MKKISEEPIAPAINFLRNANGDSSMRFALIVGAIAIVSAFIIPAVFEGNSQFANLDHLNVDSVITGSTKKTKHYIIRKSILDINENR